MTRNWIIGASASAVLHGGAAALLFATVATPQGAPATEAAPAAFQVELVSVNHAAPGVERSSAASSDSAQAQTDAVLPEGLGAGETPALPVAAPASPAGVSAPRAAPDPGVMSDYYRRLEGHLARYHVYPAGLTDSRPSGAVRVGVIVQRDGRLLDIWIERSSGVASLDQAALDTLRRAEPLPVLPNSLPAAIDLNVPLVYDARLRSAG